MKLGSACTLTPMALIRRSPREQIFKIVHDILHKDAGCTSELDRNGLRPFSSRMRCGPVCAEDRTLNSQLRL